MCINKIIATIMHHKLYNHRLNEPTKGIKYFSSEDFDSLKKEPFEFLSMFNEKVRGYIYYRDGYKEDNIVIFVHGNGGGHLAYIKEINRLTESGFRVLSYDQSGAFESEGKSLRGFYQMPTDLKALLKVMDKYFPSLPIYLVGHSLGGYSVLNTLPTASEYNVKKIVSISALREMKPLLLAHSPKGFSSALNAMLKIEEKIYGNDIYFNASTYLKDTNVKTFLIHSKDDYIVNYETHFLDMKNASMNNDNVKTLSVDEHLHNPTYTIKANKLLFKYFEKINSTKKNKEKINLMNNTDFHEISELDENIMHEIINFLNN